MAKVNIGKGIEIDVDFAAMPQVALDHVLYIGARNILMDSHASITKETNPDDLADVAKAMAEKKLEALMAGTVRVSSSRESADPVRAEAMRMALSLVKAQIRKAGGKVDDYEPASLREVASGLITPELLATAKERVEQVKAVAPVVEIAGLKKKA